MKNLIIVGHPGINSFCYSGIFKTVTQELSKNNLFKPFETEDFFRDNDQTTSITHLCKSGFVSVLDEDHKLSHTIGKQVLELLDEEW
ncbi:MAG: hypothetical protein ACKVK4_10175 [Flavobacteriales bacterium]|tara:strand:- start:51 stop:311 length:261 start_codon:yes stop_codon:yes gene_type:complete